MDLVLCLDDRLGYSYNGRRQTRDAAVRRHMMAMTRELGGIPRMSAYTLRSFLKEEDLFTEEERRLLEENVLPDGDVWFFAENTDVSAFLADAKRLLIYRWNRLYLSDLRLPADFAEGFRILEEGSLRGTSHDDVTWTLYGRDV